MREQTCPNCGRTWTPKNLEAFTNHVKACNRKDQVIEELSEPGSKFGNVRCKFNGENFDSKLEARYCKFLDSLTTTGILKYYLRQIPFHLPGNTTYRADFMEVYKGNRIKYVDCKGRITKAFTRSKKQVESLYPVEIIIVKKGDFPE